MEHINIFSLIFQQPVSTGGFGAKLRLNREVLRACRENGVQTNIFKILSKYPAKILELLRR